MPTFGEILSELRTDRKIKQKELGKLMNLSSGSISNYETGQRTPDAEMVCLFADIFNVTTDYMLGRTKINLSPDYLTKPFANHDTLGSLAEKMLSLDDEQKASLARIINDMYNSRKYRTNR